MMTTRDAFDLVQEVGELCLSEFEIAYVRRCEKKRGCPMMQDTMTKDERIRVIEYGRRCAVYKAKHRP